MSADATMRAALLRMKNEQLKELAGELGIPLVEGVSKEDFVDMMLRGGCPGCGRELNTNAGAWDEGTEDNGFKVKTEYIYHAKITKKRIVHKDVNP